MRFRLFDARGEPQRNSIPLVERSRSGLFTWSGGGAINRRAIAISPGRRARLEFHANRAASRLLVIEILEILAERVCVRVRMCERARERERERRGGEGLRLPRAAPAYYFDLPAHSTTWLLPAFCFLSANEILGIVRGWSHFEGKETIALIAAALLIRGFIFANCSWTTLFLSFFFFLFEGSR